MIGIAFWVLLAIGVIAFFAGFKDESFFFVALVFGILSIVFGTFWAIQVDAKFTETCEEHGGVRSVDRSCIQMVDGKLQKLVL